MDELHDQPSRELVKIYLEHPYVCPFCHTDNITNVDFLDPESRTIKVKCNECEAIWFDEYGPIIDIWMSQAPEWSENDLLQARMENDIKSHKDCAYPNVVIRDNLRVDWSELGEGYSGDYNPNDPDDVELLRFDVFVWSDETHEWRDPGDVSYCTRFPASATPEQRQKALVYIMDELEPNHGNLKHTCERLSWISLETLEIWRQ